MLELSVVIPCLNEETTIATCVERALDAMRAHGILGEVVVADNRSTDDSARRALGAGARVVRCGIRGYGATLRCGIVASDGQFILMADGDLSYDFALTPLFIAATRRGARFVIGSRLRGQIADGAMPLLHRYVGTPVLTWILNRLFGTRITDCNCGMRCIERATFFTLGLHSSGMEFASEMLVKAAVHGVTIAEVPIPFYKDLRGRRPHLRPFRDGWRHLRLLLWHAPDHMMTVPGLVMLALGLSLAFMQLAGPVSLGFTSLDIHYMILGVTLSLVGTSATSLGLVVGATLPAGRVRQLNRLRAAHRWYSFDVAASVAACLLIAGLVIDGVVLAYWLYHSRGILTSIYTRLTLFGLLLIAMAFQIGLSAILIGATQTPGASDSEPDGTGRHEEERQGS